MEAEKLKNNGLTLMHSQPATIVLPKPKILGKLLYKDEWQHEQVVNMMKMTLNRRDFSVPELRDEFHVRFPELTFNGLYLFPHEMGALVYFQYKANRSRC